MRRSTCASRAYNLTSLPDIEKAGPVPMETAQYVSKRPNRSLYHRYKDFGAGSQYHTPSDSAGAKSSKYYRGYPWKKLVLHKPSSGRVSAK